MRGAEYVAALVPRGTHSMGTFVTPTLAPTSPTTNLFFRHHGRAGLVYSPLADRWSISSAGLGTTGGGRGCKSTRPACGRGRIRVAHFRVRGLSAHSILSDIWPRHPSTQPSPREERARGRARIPVILRSVDLVGCTRHRAGFQRYTLPHVHHRPRVWNSLPIIAALGQVAATRMQRSLSRAAREWGATE